MQKIIVHIKNFGLIFDRYLRSLSANVLQLSVLDYILNITLTLKMRIRIWYKNIFRVVSISIQH